MAKWRITDSDLDKQIDRAKVAGVKGLNNEPRANLPVTVQRAARVATPLSSAG